MGNLVPRICIPLIKFKVNEHHHHIPLEKLAMTKHNTGLSNYNLLNNTSILATNITA
jgi:hypothetical protein